MNKVILIGRLTRDPELVTAEGKVPRCGFSVAVDRYAKAGEERQADFINCVAFRGTGEFVAKYFKKGSRIAVVGKISTRKYEKDGEKRTVVEVIADEVEFTESKKSDPEWVEDTRAKASTPAPADPNDDTALPFEL